MLDILVAAIVMFVIGAVWFTVLFGIRWSKLMNRTPEQIAKVKEQGMTRQMIIMFILNVVSVSVVCYLVPQLLAVTVGQFVCSVFLIWLGFTLPSLVNTYLWEGKSFELVAINAGGSLVSFLAGGATLFLMK